MRAVHVLIVFVWCVSGTHESGACVNCVCDVLQVNMRVVHMLIVCGACYRNTSEQ